jgi:peptidoglycan/LPS O-acetylase OafA/YrhL
VVLLSIPLSIPPNALGVPYRWYGVRWVLANVLLVQNISGIKDVASPLWSLPYEVQMYLVLPILFLLLKVPKSGVRLVVVYVVGSVVSPLYHLFKYIPCFLAGVIACEMLGRVRPRLPAWLWTPTVIGTLVYYVWAPYSTRRPKDLLFCLIVGVLIPLFRPNRGVISAIASRIAR